MTHFAFSNDSTLFSYLFHLFLSALIMRLPTPVPLMCLPLLLNFSSTVVKRALKIISSIYCTSAFTPSTPGRTKIGLFCPLFPPYESSHSVAHHNKIPPLDTSSFLFHCSKEAILSVTPWIALLPPPISSPTTSLCRTLPHATVENIDTYLYLNTFHHLRFQTVVKHHSIVFFSTWVHCMWWSLHCRNQTQKRQWLCRIPPFS